MIVLLDGLAGILGILAFLAYIILIALLVLIGIALLGVVAGTLAALATLPLALRLPTISWSVAHVLSLPTPLTLSTLAENPRSLAIYVGTHTGYGMCVALLYLPVTLDVQRIFPRYPSAVYIVFVALLTAGFGVGFYHLLTTESPHPVSTLRSASEWLVFAVYLALVTSGIGIATVYGLTVL